MDLGQLRATRSRFRFWIARCGPPCPLSWLLSVLSEFLGIPKKVPEFDPEPLQRLRFLLGGTYRDRRFAVFFRRHHLEILPERRFQTHNCLPNKLCAQNVEGGQAIPLPNSIGHQESITDEDVYVAHQTVERSASLGRYLVYASIPPLRLGQSFF